MTASYRRSKMFFVICTSKIGYRFYEMASWTHINMVHGHTICFPVCTSSRIICFFIVVPSVDPKMSCNVFLLLPAWWRVAWATHRHGGGTDGRLRWRGASLRCISLQTNARSGQECSSGSKNCPRSHVLPGTGYPLLTALLCWSSSPS